MLIRVHIFVPDATRTLSGALVGLSGSVNEFSRPWDATPGGPADQWNQLQGHTSSRWWSASQQLFQPYALDLLADGQAKMIGAWYIAANLGETVILSHNFEGLSLPESATLAAMGAAIGLVAVE